MRRGIIFILLILAALAGYFYWSSKPAIKNYPAQKGTTIVAFGDSLVYGVGSTKGNDFVSRLSARLQQPIANMGVSGNTTTQGLARVDDVLKKDPKIVLVLLGGNDFLQKVPQEQTFSNLEQIITRIQDHGSIVILLGVRGGLIQDAYASQFEDLAEKTGAAYVPNVLSGLIGNKEFMYDAVHPNDKGYEKIAEKVYPTLLEVLY